MKKLLASLCLLVSVHALAVDYTVEEVRQFTDSKTGLTVIQGQVRLPGPGFWNLGKGDVFTEGLSDVRGKKGSNNSLVQPVFDIFDMF